MHSAILNAGQSTDYLYGLVTALARQPQLTIDVIDGDSSAQLFNNYPNVHHYNLRGNTLISQPLVKKTFQILRYYYRLIIYTLRTRATIFHIQWDNSILLFDRTLLLLFYKLLGKKILYTVHNVDKQLRDFGHSNLYNRLSLFSGYHLADHLIVHTQAMKEELSLRFRVPPKKISVIPHGINVRTQVKNISQHEAREQLGIPENLKVLLFFGLIDYYKGLDIALEAFKKIADADSSFFFLIAGKPKRDNNYIHSLQQYAANYLNHTQYRFDIRFIEPEEVEYYFSASDCVLLPYRSISHSGILFLAYTYGLPVITADLPSFREDIRESVTGLLFEPMNSDALANTIVKFFGTKLYIQKEETRQYIKAFAQQHYNWESIASATVAIYKSLQQ